MNPWILATLIALGVAVGTVSGMLGIGGAIMIIPALTFIYGFTQQQANGTSLAVLLPPIAILAVLEYNRKGLIDWPVAIALMIGFVVGAPLGAKLVTHSLVSDRGLRLTFGFFLIFVACRQLFKNNAPAGAALFTVITMGGFWAVWFTMRRLGMHWSKQPYWPGVYRRRVEQPAVGYDYEI